MDNALAVRSLCRMMLALIAGGAFILLLAGSLGAENGYPRAELSASAKWLHEQISSGRTDLIVVDVREDGDSAVASIPGAVRLPWRMLRTMDAGRQIPGVFVGVGEAVGILGRHGIERGDEVVLYDSVERDGGATASYVFWVLDLLGHERKRILDGGIDAWKAAGFETSASHAPPEPVQYDAPAAEMRLDRLVDSGFIQSRLGDRYYQILDARSPGEYSGEIVTQGMDGAPLKRGHVPTAFNRHYVENWQDQQSKKVRSYEELRKLYPGLDSQRAVITYCTTARRGSYAYYILRLMGFEDVRLYDDSWFQWGAPGRFYPVEKHENSMSGPLPRGAQAAT